jgi:organic radical activating enzyme
MHSKYTVTGGKIESAQCEINIVEHCNLSCRSCSHLSPVMRRHEMDPQLLERDLTLLGRHYHVGLVKLLGGEPLLHRGLLEVIGAVRRCGVADRIAIITNGVLLTRMPAEFWAAVDKVIVSLYPGNKQTAEDLDRWRQTATAAGVDLVIQPTDQFQESYSELGTEDQRLVRRIYRSCDLAHTWRCHTITDGHFWKCPQAYFLAKLLGPDQEHLRYEDAVRIDDEPTLAERLLAYLESPEPLDACQHCLGSAGKAFPHARVSRGDFRAAQRRPSEDLVDYRKLAPRPVRRVRTRLQRMR